MPNLHEEKPQELLNEDKGKSLEELRKLAFTDELTGLMNRRFLRNRLPVYIEKALSKSSEITLSILDLDGFKSVNDTYGHLAGDHLLKAFARLLKSSIGPNAIPIRFAGDEFVAIFFNKDKIATKSILDGLLDNLHGNPITVAEGESVKIAGSAGIANYPSDAHNYEDLFRRADEALYFAKDIGKYRVVIYPDEGKLVAPGNISTMFPVGRTIGFEDIEKELSLLTYNRLVTDEIEPEFPIVFGPRGSGKTRLLNELCKMAATKGRRIICLQSAHGNEKPYFALISAFGEALRADINLMREIAKELSNEELVAIGEDIPELRDFAGMSNVEEKESSENTVIFRALNVVLFGLLRGNRSLMVIDDANEIDQVTLEFLDSFLAEFPGSQLDLVFTLVSDTPEQKEQNASYLLGCMSRFAQMATVTSLDMPLFRKPDIASMIAEITGLREIPGNLLDILLDRSHGNPQFIEELLQFVIEAGIIDYNGTRWEMREFSEEEIPNSIDGILEERAKRLLTEEREILKQASVLGQTFDIRVLATICDKNEAELLKDLERPRRAHIIFEEKGRENEFSFHSVAMREAFYSTFDQDSLKEAHIHAAEIELDINKGNEELVFGKVARHFQQAGEWRSAARIIAASKERFARAKIPEATRRMLQRKAFEADMAKESPLEKEDIAKAVKVVRYVKVAAMALRLYPRENENVSKAIDKSFEGITSFFSKTEVLTFSVADTDVLINGQNPGPEERDPRLAQEFRQMISPYMLQGMIFTRGLTKEELERFLAIFSEKPEDVVEKWEDILTDRALLHVRPDRKIYIALGQSKISLGNEVITVDTAQKDGGADSKVAQAALESIRELIEEFHRESKELLDALEAKDDSNEEIEKLIGLLENITGYFPEEHKAARKKVIENREESNVGFEIEPEAKEELKLAEAIQEVYTEEFKAASASEIQEWIADLKNSDRIRKARAAQSLLRQGKTALNACANSVLTEEDPQARRLIATILKKIGKSGELHFASSLAHAQNDESLINLLSVSDVFFDSKSVGDAIVSAIRNPSKAVQKATLQALSKFPEETKCAAVMISLASPDFPTKALGIYLIGAFKLKRLLPSLLDIIAVDSIRNEDNLPLAITATRALGSFSSDTVVDRLGELIIIENSSSVPENIRIESIKALVKIGSSRAISILKDVSNDVNNPLSGEALNALKRPSGE
jgi:diguanylate cyclase (GGDEF)-like protein